MWNVDFELKKNYKGETYNLLFCNRSNLSVLFRRIPLLENKSREPERVEKYYTKSNNRSVSTHKLMFVESIATITLYSLQERFWKIYKSVYNSCNLHLIYIKVGSNNATSKISISSFVLILNFK